MSPVKALPGAIPPVRRVGHSLTRAPSRLRCVAPNMNCLQCEQHTTVDRGCLALTHHCLVTGAQVPECDLDAPLFCPGYAPKTNPEARKAAKSVFLLGPKTRREVTAPAVRPCAVAISGRGLWVVKASRSFCSSSGVHGRPTCGRLGSAGRFGFPAG